MNFIGRLRHVLEQLRGGPDYDCMRRDARGGTGEIIVRQADPDLVPCALGGRMHCTHGQSNCCWCRIGERARSMMN
jgi:hypothetical protein